MEKQQKVFNYSELLNSDYNTKINELKKYLHNEEIELVINFEDHNYNDEELKKYFNFIIENKGNKIIMLRKITEKNYKKLNNLKNRYLLEKLEK